MEICCEPIRDTFYSCTLEKGHLGEHNCWELENQQKQAEKNDPINHPSHYTSGNIEVIDYIEDQKLGFNLGNCIKYVSRAGKKESNTLIGDLKKAAWYLNREIENVERAEKLNA